MKWTLRHGVVDFSAGPVVMGVLNVTPDSFSDSGRHFDQRAAILRADEIVAEGAGIIDIGAESTQPGAAPVDADEQIRRIEYVLTSIRERHPSVAISIDTRIAHVAEKAVALGADIINDVSALRGDPAMAGVACDRGVPVILMHMRGTPETMQRDVRDDSYGDVVAEVETFLRGRIVFARGCGIEMDAIAIDPGIGFGKTTDHNLAILSHVGELAALGVPVVIGASRKRFVGEITGCESPGERVAGSLTCAVAAVLGGANVIRAHDVRATVQAVRMAAAIRSHR